MELIETNNTTGLFFPQHEFELLDKNMKVCRLMAMEVIKGVELDLTVITNPEYQGNGYASLGVKMLIQWAINNGYKKVALTNLSNSRAIDKIAEKLCFKKDGNNSWTKSIIGPLNL